MTDEAAGANAVAVLDCGHPCVTCQRAAYSRDLERRRMERASASADREVEAVKVDLEMRDLYVSGCTLEQIGVEYGYTRERIRQRIQRVDPSAAIEVRLRRAAEKAEREAAAKAAAEKSLARRIAERGIPCVTCGTRTLKHRGSSKRATCSPRCRQIFLDLVNHIDRPDRQFIRPGTHADRAALVALSEGLPIFDRLPPGIQAQIRGDAPRIPSYQHLRGLKPKVTRSCERCGAETTKKRFCSVSCYRAAGIGRKSS